MKDKLTLSTVDGGRQFPCGPAAIVVFLIDTQERVLLMAHPKRGGVWEVISGALEHNESIWAGALREVEEEVGLGVKVRPLGAVHVSTFQYDPNVTHMLCLELVMAYDGGEVVPGDDMKDSTVRWFSFDELDDPTIKLWPPTDRSWLRERVLELYRLW